MKKLYISVLLALVAIGITSCDDTTNTVGKSLTDNTDILEVSTSIYEVTSRSLKTDSVLSSSTTGFLGKIIDPETLGDISCDFMAQFHSVEDFDFPDEDEIFTDDHIDIRADSCEIRLFYRSFYGDSIAKMKVQVSELAKPLEEGNYYYSNYDPREEGYLRTDANALKKTKIYTLANQEVSDSVKSSSSYVRSIRIPLNDPYTDKKGNTYNNYGTYILQELFKDLNNFTNSYNFVHNICPGFYFEIQDGVGSMAYISLCQLNVYFRVIPDGKTIRNTSLTFSATEEVLQTSTISNEDEIIEELAKEKECTYLKTPAGIFTELTLPIDEIMANHSADSINTAKIVLNTINNKSQIEYAFDDPETLLMVQKDSLYEFFEKKYVANNKTSFLAELDDNIYTFANISNLIKHLYDVKNLNLERDPNWVAEHKNWNKVVLVPVTTTYVATASGTTRLARVMNDMSLTTTRLVGGENNPYESLKINVVYSHFKGR